MEFLSHFFESAFFKHTKPFLGKGKIATLGSLVIFFMASTDLSAQCVLLTEDFEAGGLNCPVNLPNWQTSHGSSSQISDDLVNRSGLSLRIDGNYLPSSSNGAFVNFPLQAGTDYLITFDMAIGGFANDGWDATINIDMANGVPFNGSCNTVGSPPTNGITQQNIFQHTEETSASTVDPYIHQVVPACPNTNFSQLWFFTTLVNNASEPGARFYIDNLQIETYNANFNFTIEDCEVQFQSLCEQGIHNWDFGDGNASTQVNPVHFYQSPGTYNVTHQVTTVCGNVLQSTQQVIIEDYGCSDPNFIFFQSSVVCNSIQFEGICGEDYQTWDFGDGNTSSSSDPLHIYNAPGTYTVVHTVEKACGVFNSQKQQITVVDDGCMDNFTCHCPNMEGIYINAGTGASINQTGLINNTFQSPVIPGFDIFPNECIAVNGQLIFDNPTGLVIFGGEMAMNPGAEMVVANGSVLRLFDVKNNGGVHGCDIMWRGVTVNDGGSFETQSSLIQDAQHAVTALNGATIGHFSTRFLNNHIGIHSPGGSVATNFISDNRFSQNRDLLPAFNTVVLYDATAAYAGVEIDGVPVFGIGNAFGGDNIFSNIRNGIVAQNSLLISQNNTFTQMVGNRVGTTDLPPLAAEGIGIYLLNSVGRISNNNNFNSTSTGIHAQESSLVAVSNAFDAIEGMVIINSDNRNLDIRNNNNITFSKAGIRIQETENPLFLNIKNNQFFFTENDIEFIYSNAVQGIYATNSGMGNGSNNDQKISANLMNLNLVPIEPNVFKYSFGMFLIGMDNYEIDRNTINFTDPNQNEGRGIGIYISNGNGNYFFDNTVNGSGSNTGGIGNTSSSNKWCCNSVNGDGGGGMSFQGMSDGTILRHTNLNGNIGIGLNATGTMGVQGTPITQQNGGTHGNRWNGIFTTGARHAGSDIEVSGSRFHVESPVQQPFWPPLPINPSDWFQATIHTSPTCAGDAVCPVPPNVNDDDPDDEITDNDIRYARNKFDQSGSVPLINWEGKRYLYRRLKQYPTMLSEGNAVIDSFYLAMENSNFKLFYEVEEAVSNLYEVDSLTAAKMEADMAVIENLNQSVSSVDSLLQFAATAQDTALLIAQRQGYLSQMAAPFQNLQSAKNSLWTQRINGTNAIIAMNTNIAPVDSLEINLRTVNDVFLNTVAKGIAQLDNNQFNRIGSVAFQCPDQGGKAVYRARALYNLNVPFHFDDGQICANGGGNAGKNPQFLKVAETGFGLFPNPANTVLSIKLEGDVTGKETAEVAFYSMTGELVKQQQFTGMGRTIEMNIGDIANGVYWCKVKLENVEVGSQKLVVLR